MKIATIQPTDKNYNNAQLNNTCKVNKQNLAFKSATLAAAELAKKAALFLWAINKTDKAFSSHKMIYKVVDNIDSTLNHLDAEPNTRAIVLTSLSKLKSGADKTAGYEFYCIFKSKNLHKISELKELALNKLIYEMDDNNDIQRVAKQELLRSMFYNGEYTSDSYIKAFKNLPDSHYGKFKEAITDLCLFNADNSESYSNPIRLIYNRKLVDALDKKNHAEYLSKSKQGQFILDHTIDVFANKKLTEKHNLAYKYYCYDGNAKDNYLYMYDMDLWKPYTQKAFDVNLLLSEGKPEKLAELLKIDEYLAEDIIRDYKVLDMAEEIDDKSAKLALYKMRIDEKFDTILPNEDMERDLPEKYIDLHTKYNNILNFINKTDMAKELNMSYENKIKGLYYKYDEVYHNFNNASVEDEIPLWAHGDY